MAGVLTILGQARGGAQRPRASADACRAAGCPRRSIYYGRLSAGGRGVLPQSVPCLAETGGRVERTRGLLKASHESPAPRPTAPGNRPAPRGGEGLSGGRGP